MDTIQSLNPMCKVWNDNDREYVEFFNGREVRIPAKGYVQMELSEAANFRGQFAPMTKMLPDRTKIANPKMIRIEVIKGVPKAEEQKIENTLSNKCMLCGEVAKSAAGLAAHMRFRHPEAKPEKERGDDSNRTGNVLS